jgi:D-alanyl-D-alanine carboxypeptidase/D-alanyl-D-alanine-endopeptidase (penicillin-binding protein 4)
MGTGDQHLANGARVTSRFGRAAVLIIALLIAFTLAASTAVATLLPKRLALWKVPTVAGHPIAGAPAVLGPAAAPTGPPVTAAGVAAQLAGTLGLPALGPEPGAYVTSLDSGQVLLDQGASRPATPASTAKLATAVASLSVLGPSRQLRTRVVAGATAGQIVLVGGGDPTLTAGPAPATSYPRPASLSALAAATARKLLAQHRKSVSVGYDTSLYTGPDLGPGWPVSYISTGNVTAITSLEADQGRLTPAGQPQDIDDPANFAPRSLSPAGDAATAFASFLSQDGITVQGPPALVTAPSGAAALASVASPPVAQIVQWMLIESNNVIAENLARQVAIATHRPATFAGSAAAVVATGRNLGVTGLKMADGSGLSPLDRITPRALVQLVTMAAKGSEPGLRPAITGLPVAGFAGTLAPGGSVFGSPGPPASGVVRAKTGNLSNVVTLAGITTAANGQLLAFAFMADQVPKGQLSAAGAAIDQLAAELAGCGCG